VGVTVRDIRAYKERGEKFPMLTAYDAPHARLLDEAGIPILLVGDSVGNNVLGYSETVPVTMEQMLHHAAAVVRGVDRALVVGDMPFMSYQASLAEGMRNAGRFLKEAGTTAVKMEGGARVLELVHHMTEAGIPVMGHLGHTPQSVNQFGGHRVQGRDAEQAQRILQDAKDLESAGAFAVVLEAVPAELAKEVTETLEVPTIGIGAGPHCTGQVLVLHDMLGMNTKTPKFVKRYAEIGAQISEAAQAFAADVAAGVYPAEEHTYR
jgi:3-methyl-2-oxobutanoate hydroxymethyltransferase